MPCASGVPRTVGAPLAAHVAPVEEEPGGFVLLDVRRAESLGQPAQAPAPPQIDLEQAFAGGVEALDEKEVRFAGGVDVRHAQRSTRISAGASSLGLGLYRLRKRLSIQYR